MATFIEPDAHASAANRHYFARWFFVVPHSHSRSPDFYKKSESLPCIVSGYYHSSKRERHRQREDRVCVGARERQETERNQTKLNTIIMTESSHDSSSATNKPQPFPAKASVILHGLKAEEFNGKIGIVQQGVFANEDEGRQQVFVEELNKTVALKVSNMKYQPRPLDSLSVKECKKILQSQQTLLKFQGMDKADLRAKIQELVTEKEDKKEDQEEEAVVIAELLAHANAAGSSSSTTSEETKSVSTSTTNSTTFSRDKMQAGMQQFDQLTPEQLRHQAMMMRSMPPSQIRQMNPQLASMTDAQIEQSIVQMEMMASNPDMMNMARQQMKNMKPEDLEQMMKGGGGGANMAGMGAIPPSAASGTGQTATTTTSLDPATMLETMDIAQIKSTLQMLQENPDMLQNLAQQTGLPKDKLEQMLSMFTGMSDDQLEKSLKTMAKVQSISNTVKSLWHKTDAMMGGYLKPILVATGVVFVVVLVLYLLGGSSPDLEENVSTMMQDATAASATEEAATTTVPPPSVAAVEEEFQDEF
jgi:hypothetical protein